MTQHAPVVGVDLGGTKTTVALVDADGTVGRALTVPTPAGAGPGAVLDAVADAVRSLGAGAPAAVGVGTAGVVDVGRGTIVSATDVMPGWPGTDVAAGLRERLGTDVVHVENDVDAHAAGEAWLGAAAGRSSALVVAVGTGVGAAVVLDGTVLRGAHHVAGEMGHVPTPGAEGLRCPCGRPGHLEGLGAGPAVLRRYVELGGDPATPDTRDVVARADAGDPLALRAVADAAGAIGRATAGIVTVLDPEIVVFAGGLSRATGGWWPAMLGALRAELIDVLAGVPVVLARLDNAAVVGAARGAHRALARIGGIVDPTLAVPRGAVPATAVPATAAGAARTFDVGRTAP